MFSFFVCTKGNRVGEDRRVRIQKQRGEKEVKRGKKCTKEG